MLGFVKAAVHNLLQQSKLKDPPPIRCRELTDTMLPHPP